MTRDESHVSVGGLLALGYEVRKKSRKKERKIQSANCTEGTLTDIGSKWKKKQKRRNGV